MGPRAGLDGCGKSRPNPGFDPRTVQPVAIPRKRGWIKKRGKGIFHLHRPQPGFSLHPASYSFRVEVKMCGALPPLPNTSLKRAAYISTKACLPFHFRHHNDKGWVRRDLSPLFGSEVKNTWNYTSNYNFPFITRCLIKYTKHSPALFFLTQNHRKSSTFRLSFIQSKFFQKRNERYLKHFLLDIYFFGLLTLKYQNSPPPFIKC